MALNQTVVKARRVGSSIVLSCPYAEEGRAYNISQTSSGVIIFHPVRTIEEMRESNAGHKNMTLGQFTEENPSYYHPEYERGEF